MKCIGSVRFEHEKVREIVNRLVDNYEDKGDMGEDWYYLTSLIAIAINDCPLRGHVVELALKHGVIEDPQNEGFDEDDERKYDDMMASVGKCRHQLEE